jgi:hypothetical protein
MKGKITILGLLFSIFTYGQANNGTIKVVYYFNKEHQNTLDTVLLNLTTYTSVTKTTYYYIFPDYDAKNGIEKVKLSYVDFDYWEGCETGKGECNPLTFTRNSTNGNWYLIMPCGRNTTSVTLSERQRIPKGNDIIQKEEISHSECPPIFELTNLKDGKYFAYMLACGLGGQIEINLKTEKKSPKTMYIKIMRNISKINDFGSYQTLCLSESFVLCNSLLFIY